MASVIFVLSHSGKPSGLLQRSLNWQLGGVERNESSHFPLWEIGQ